MNTARREVAGAGVQTAALAFGGGQPGLTATELWNGTSWASNPTGLSNGRGNGAGSGTQTSALMSGGASLTTALTAATEEWTGTVISNNTVTVS
jgi:hypothetical protein